MDEAPFPPPGATDCHAHVAGAAARYPMMSPRAYTPMEASVETLKAMLARLGLERIVLVQMSVYGIDNRCMTDAMAALGARARGVVQLDADTPASELDRLHRMGVRGIRVNLHTTGANDPDSARRTLAAARNLCVPRGWHVQLFTTAEMIAALRAEIFEMPVPVVLDHFGLLSAVERGGAAERTVMALLREGPGWVKLSGTYRLEPPDRATAAAALARDLADANPERVVWGSDWPHTPPHPTRSAEAPPPEPYRNLDTAALLDAVRDWFTEPRRQRHILVDNPARLYDF